MRGIKWSLFVMIFTLAVGVKCELNLLLRKTSNTGTDFYVTCYNTDTSSYVELYNDILIKRGTGKVQNYLNKTSSNQVALCESNKTNIKVIEVLAKSSLNCTRGYFGKDCNIKCEEVLGKDYKHCQKHLICSNKYNNRKCFCAPGYWGGHCANDCKEKKNKRKKDYCNNGCGHCDYTIEGQHCDLDTKQCNSTCVKGYMGPSCTQRTVELFEKVTAKDIDYNSVNIHIDFIKHDKINNNDISVYIGVKEWGDTYVRPTTVKLSNYVYVEQEIDDLKPGMNYSLDITFDGVPVVQQPVFYFTTKCDDLEEDNTNIGINENGSTFEIKITTKGDEKNTCNIRLYKVKVNEIEVDEKKYEIKDDGELIIQNVYFCNKSTITLYNPESNKQIKSIEYTPTTEPAPGVVNTVQNRSSTEDSIHIEWSPPDNGCNIVGYEVSYKLHSYKGCAYVSDNESQKIDNTTSTSYEITGLKPYSRYDVSVTAYNTKRGKKTFNLFDTKEKDIPTETITELKIINLDHTNVILQWAKPECTSITGSLQYKVTVLRTSISNDTTGTTVTLHPLEAYTKYIVEVVVMRPSTGELSDVQSITFTTNPTAPPAVRELQVYSHTDTSIGLRWKHPKPANGQLEHYRVDYNNNCLYSGVNYKDITNIDTSCDLWKEYFCYELNNLTSNKECTVRVYAYNKNVNKTLSKESSVKATTKFTGPGQPPDLSTEFLNNTELLVKWRHPIEHGPVYNFYVGARVVDSNVGALNTSETIQVVKPKEEYTHQFSLSQSTTYKVCVRGTNKLEGVSNCTTVITEPEAIEFTLNTEKLKDHFLVFIETKDKICRNCTALIFVENDKKIVDESKKNAPQDVKNVYSNSKEWTNATNNEPYNISRTEVDHDLHITVILFNCYKHKCKRQDKYVIIETESFPLGYIFLLFLLIIPAAVIVIIFIRFKNRLKKHNGIDSLPPKLSKNRNNGEAFDSKSVSNAMVGRQELKSPPVRNITDNVPEVENRHYLALVEQKFMDTEYTYPINMSGFRDYVKSAIETQELNRQHSLFPRGMTLPSNYGNLEQNKSKNRYSNLQAYDHTRVKLKKLPNDPYSDYINANYIEGYNMQRAYIATQGPKPNTVIDFWRMIWQENTTHIIMLANVIENNKKKCEQYWPPLSKSCVYGDVHVRHDQTEMHADYERKIFTVTCQTKKRIVEQLHFTAWPDHGVPMYASSLVPLLKQMALIQMPGPPIVVHCSAGVGRTGTIILCDICIRMSQAESRIDPFGYLNIIRKNRANMVDNTDQYKLVHLVLLECLVIPETNYQCNEKFLKLMKDIVDAKILNRQMKLIDEYSWMDDAMEQKYKNRQRMSIEPSNQVKNRFRDICPDDFARVRLQRWPPTDAMSDYINAVFVHGYRIKNQFIVTQQPMPNTVSDFWRLVVENKPRLIVSLNLIDERDQSIANFYPLEGATIEATSYLNITHKKTINMEYYQKISLQVHDSNQYTTENEYMSVTLLQCTKWAPGTNIPAMDKQQLIQFWETIQRFSSNVTPIIIVCYDGVRASGLLTALSFVIEKIKLEHTCDVCLAVKSIRHNRKQFIRDPEQFEYLYRAAIGYVNSFELYSNLQALEGN